MNTQTSKNRFLALNLAKSGRRGGGGRMPYLRPSSLLLMVLSVLLSVLILSCDPDEAKKKPSENNTTQDNQDDNQDQNDNNDNQTNKPPEKIPATKLTRTKSTLPVASLGTISSQTAANDGGTDASDTVWVFQDKEITFKTKAKDKDGNEIPAAQFTWEWRKHDKETTTKFGHTWEEITGQTTATATLDIPAKERVGAYELRVSATSGKKTVNNHKETPYKFTVRKSGCPAPSATNQPADHTELKALIQDPLTLTDTELQAIDISKLNFLGIPFLNNPNFNQNISCWDVSNVTDMNFTFYNTSMFNKDIGDWDTSKVTNMSSAFENAGKFNQDISRWDTSEVTNMNSMFKNAAAFNQDLSGWDVSKVTNSTDFATDASDWTKAKPSWP